jgi:hypothetical protein
MREHVLRASRRRDERLARIRKLTIWITGGAAAASLGMGTAFAHAIPGHTASSTSTSTSSNRTSTGAPPAGTNASSSGTSGTTAGRGRQRGHHHGHKLAPPAQAPVSTPAPPVVTSGGS